MMIHPHFDPIAIHLGTWTLPMLGTVTPSIRWYGLMYLVGFVLFLMLGHYRIRKQPASGWTSVQLDDLLFYGVLGVILGGRLGYVLFYKPSYYLHHLSEIPHVWEGGMSFHGGFLGVLVAMIFFARKTGRTFFDIADFVAPLVPQGLGFGRLGNFINGELWGRATSPDAPWAMLFEGDPKQLPRHPSQLYEMTLEGIVLFGVLWWFSRTPRPRGQISALFLMGYGMSRFLVEFTREPDDFLGLLSFGMSMGQWLSLPMIIGGIIMFIWAGKRAK
jgi:phosphatidylglycerol:prolipoprotein diacylglycerol transferase